MVDVGVDVSFFSVLTSLQFTIPFLVPRLSGYDGWPLAGVACNDGHNRC